MKDLKRISWLAILLIVVLRISIGWQFLYEGMWKYSQMNGPSPWSAEGYLKNAQGPYRDYFRNMTGDPDDLNWLDYEKMSAKWYDWRDRFVSHYKLNEEQKALLNLLLDASAEEDTAPGELPPIPVYSRKLEVLPKGVKLDRYRGTVEFDEKSKTLSVLAPVTPLEEVQIKRMVDVVETGDRKMPYARLPEKDAAEDAPLKEADPTDVAFYRAFSSMVNDSRKPIEVAISSLNAKAKKADSGVNGENLSYASSRISTSVKRSLPYRQRLAASLLGDPDRIGVFAATNERGSFDYEMGTVTRQEEGAEKNNIKFGKIKEYRELLDEIEAALKQASIDYQYDHVTMLNRKAAIMRSDLVGPVKALEKELQDNALKILTADQLSLGAMPPADTPLHRADMAAMWGLLILGPLLIVGLFSRLAAVLGAVMVLSFYLVIPPWPGVPPAPGPEHSLIINKNMIEVIALLGIAALPTGTWFGIDSFFYHLFFRSKSTASESES